MTVVFSIDFTGSPDADDLLAARHAIFLENRRRSQLVPPGTPLAFATPAQVKTSYLSILTTGLNARHLDYADAAKNESGVAQRFTLAQVQQMHANLVTRLNAGATAQSIVDDTAA